MKTFVKAIFNSFGYDIKRATKPSKLVIVTHGEQGIEFIHDEEFKIEFTHLTLDGNQYYVPKYALHRPAVRNLLNGNLYEPDTHNLVKELFKYFIGSMVHAGTFFGDMIPSFSKFVSGSVYAFEPVFENYILAKICLDSNKLTNVILVNSALSNDLGNLCINSTESDGKHAGGASAISEKGKICTAMTIDSLSIEDLVLIQLDVEGHELNALEGAQETIDKNRPVIAIEDNNNNCSDFLANSKYESAGHIPGLKIWVPIENNKYKSILTSLLS